MSLEVVTRRESLKAAIRKAQRVAPDEPVLDDTLRTYTHVIGVVHGDRPKGGDPSAAVLRGVTTIHNHKSVRGDGTLYPIDQIPCYPPGSALYAVWPTDPTIDRIGITIEPPVNDMFATACIRPPGDSLDRFTYNVVSGVLMTVSELGNNCTTLDILMALFAELGYTIEDYVQAGVKADRHYADMIDRQRKRALNNPNDLYECQVAGMAAPIVGINRAYQHTRFHQHILGSNHLHLTPENARIRVSTDYIEQGDRVVLAAQRNDDLEHVNFYGNGGDFYITAVATAVVPIHSHVSTILRMLAEIADNHRSLAHAAGDRVKCLNGIRNAHARNIYNKFDDLVCMASMVGRVDDAAVMGAIEEIYQMVMNTPVMLSGAGHFHVLRETIQQAQYNNMTHNPGRCRAFMQEASMYARHVLEVLHTVGAPFFLKAYHAMQHKPTLHSLFRQQLNAAAEIHQSRIGTVIRHMPTLAENAVVITATM